MSRRRQILFITMACTGVLLACGNTSSATGVVRKAGPKTEGQGTAAVNFAVTSNASGAPVTSDGSGATDFNAKLVRGTFTVNGVPGVPDGAKADGIVTGQLIYARLLGSAAHPLGLKQDWIQVDLRQLANIPGLDLGTITMAGSINPHVVFLFAGGVTSATKVGAETVNGTKVTHYRATVDLNQAVKELSGDDATLINKDLASYTSATFPEEVWVDSAGLMRKVTFSVSVKGAAGKGPSTQTVSYEFPSFGAVVDTGLPPTADTADLTDVLAKVAAQPSG